MRDSVLTADLLLTILPFLAYLNATFKYIGIYRVQPLTSYSEQKKQAAAIKLSCALPNGCARFQFGLAAW